MNKKIKTMNLEMDSLKIILALPVNANATPVKVNMCKYRRRKK